MPSASSAAASPNSLPRALPVPLTFGGIVNFSRQSGAWFLVAWILAASTAAIVCLGFVLYRWVPVVESLIPSLPPTLEIAEGKLTSQTGIETLRDGNRFLTIVLTQDAQGPETRTSHLQIILTPTEIRTHSLFGYLQFSYPSSWSLDLSPAFLEPWWAARKILFGIGGFFVVSGSLLITWTTLATLYFVPIWIFAYFGDCECPVIPIWRLAGSTLLPGALVMTLAIVLYGLHLLGLLGLMVATAIHFVAPWIYATGAVRRLPKATSALPSNVNPFADPPSETDQSFED